MAFAQEAPERQGEVVVPQSEFSRGVPTLGQRRAKEAAGSAGTAGPSAEMRSNRQAAPKTGTKPSSAASSATQDEFGFDVAPRREGEVEYLLPTGWQIKLAHTFGDLSRVQFGGANWLSEDWALGFDVGFDYSRRKFNQMHNGVAQPVTQLRYDVVPEVVVMRTLFRATTKRFLVSLAGGPVLRKEEGKSLETGYTIHAGPGIDWPLSKQLSFHFEQWVTFVSEPNPAVGEQIAFQPQLSMIWWFQ